MQIRGLMFVTIALFLGIIALIFHLLAMYSPRWKITKRDRAPAMAPVSYGLWERCEDLTIPITKQGVALGNRPNVTVCRPNRYLRYSADKFESCYYFHRNCPVMTKSQLPAGCSCRYLPSAKALQWLTVLAAICLILGLLILYFRAIASSQNESADLLLSFGPFICFVLTLLLMITTLILLGAYLRRDTYEDFTFPLLKVSNDTAHLQGFDLHSLRNYAKHYASKFSHERYLEAEKELRDDANTHYHTVIGRATVYEIIATILLFVITGITFLFGTMAKADNI